MLFSDLEHDARSWLDAEGVASADRALTRSAGLRYMNQAYEIALEFPATGDLAGVIAAFHAQHQREYGWSSSALPVELVNIGVTAYGRLKKLVLPRLDGPQPGQGAVAAWRDVYYGPAKGRLRTPVFDYARLAPGWQVEGPAIVEHPFSTVLVQPGHRASLDRHGSVLMEVDT
jgi:N-methylhydantoinase A